MRISDWSSDVCSSDLCLWLGTGQGETENGTSVGIGTGPKPAMVRLNNSTADIEPHAQAFRLGAVKRFEQAFWIFQSVATVDDRDLDQGSLVGNNYVQYPVFAFLHCFYTVFKQVQ